MNKRLMWALILIGLAVIVLIFNARGGSASVNLIFDTVAASRAMVYLGFIAWGVLIGILIK